MIRASGAKEVVDHATVLNLYIADTGSCASFVVTIGEAISPYVRRVKSDSVGNVCVVRSYSVVKAVVLAVYAWQGATVQ